MKYTIRQHLHMLEKRLADKAELRERKAIAAHMAAVNASLSKPPEQHQGRTEPMPYRLHIAVAFASLASALASLYWWYPR